MNCDREEDEYHYKILMVRSKSPIWVSLTLGDNAEVQELKSHDSDDDSLITRADQESFIQPETYVDQPRAKAIWSSIQNASQLHLNRSASSTSSFSVINEDQLNDSANSLVADGEPHSFVPSHSPSSRREVDDVNEDDYDEENKSSASGMVMLNMQASPVANWTNLSISVDQKTNDSYYPNVLSDAHSDSLICLGMEFALRIVEVLKEQERSPVTPLSLSLTTFAKSLVKWAERSEEHQKHLASLLRRINLQSLNTEQLIDLSKMRLIRKSLECRDIIDVSKNGLLMSMSTSLQSPETYNYVYILARGYQKTWEHSIHQINLATGISKKIPTKQAILLAVLADSLLVFGHRNPRNRSVDVYNLERKMWTSMTNWPIDLVISSMCTFANCIYFTASIGVSHNFYKYDPSSDEFRMILAPSRITIRENDKISVFDKQILFISSGAAYDPVLFKWNFFVPFPSSLSSHPLTIFNDKLIYLDEPERFYWFDPKNGKRGLHSSKSTNDGVTPGKVIDLVVTNSKLYIIQKCSNGVQIMNYDEETSTWIDCFKVDLQNEPLRCAVSTDNN
uniref:BACK domain-containing protein n=1 Tax=Tetranychus urticae TaxID=32264 RepID=T1KRL0_TETUR